MATTAVSSWVPDTWTGFELSRRALKWEEYVSEKCEEILPVYNSFEQAPPLVNPATQSERLQRLQILFGQFADKRTLSNQANTAFFCSSVVNKQAW